MKKTILFAAICSMLLAMPSCKKVAQNMSDNASKLGLVADVRGMRAYPDNIQACDSIMKNRGYEAEKLNEEGTTVWTRVNSGSVSRTKSVNEVVTMINYRADAIYSSYNNIHARTWALDAYKCEGKNYYFRGTYDDKPFETYAELYDLLENEPATGCVVSYKYDTTEGSLIISPNTKGGYSFTFQHTDLYYK